MEHNTVFANFQSELKAWVDAIKKYDDRIMIKPVDDFFCALTVGQRSVTIMGTIYPVQKTAIGVSINATLYLIYYSFDKPDEMQKSLLYQTDIVKYYPDRVWYQTDPAMDPPPKSSLDKIEALIWEHLQIKKPGE